VPGVPSPFTAPAPKVTVAESSAFDFAAAGSVVGKIADAFASVTSARASADAERIRARAGAVAASNAVTASTPIVGGLSLAGLVPLVGLALAGAFLLKLLGRR
jgi:hypothetical protein